MQRVKYVYPFVFILFYFGISPVQAVTDKEFKALESQMNQLADALEQQQSTTANSDTHIGGYGELHYNNISNPTGSRQRELDFHRFVLTVNHEFNSDIRLFTEIEIEHALVEDTGAGDSPGELELEQAYIQFDLNKNTHLDAGIFLLPVGIINETHEPTAFYGVERNPVETNIIPATWWEGGAMLSGNLGKSGLSYDFAVHSGLAGGTNIRGGRQKVAKANANAPAVTARAKYTGRAGLEVAATLQYQTDMTQSKSDNIDAGILLETHAVFNQDRFTAKALYARWDIGGVGAGNEDSQDGLYVEGGYKLTKTLGVFVRQNIWDNGGGGNTKEKQLDLGVSYWAHEDVVIKADYQSQNSAAGDGDGINLGLGFQF